jgi:hypothetical protein
MLRILPSHERVEDELLRSAARDGASLGGAALPWPELVALLSPEEPVGALAQRAIMEGCARETALGPLDAVKARAGFAEAALDAIAALKAGRCRPEELERLAERVSGPRAPRLAAIARLYSEYQRSLAALAAGDPSDRLFQASARLDDEASPLPPALAAADVVAFEDLYDLSPLRLEIVLALARRFEAEGRGQRVQLLLPHDPERPEVMGFVDPIWEEVYRRAGESRALDLAPKSYGEEGSGPARLARSLFRRAKVPWEGPPAAQVLSCATVREEAAAVARSVLARLEAGVSPESIAVAVRQLDAGGQRLADALEAIGIPADLRRGPPLSRSRMAALARTLLDQRERGLSREGLETALAAGRRRSGSALAALRETGLVHDEDARGSGAFRRALAILAERRRRLGKGGGGALRSLEAVGEIERALERMPGSPATAEAHVRGLLAALDGVAPAVRRVDPRCEGGGIAALRMAAQEQAAAAAVRHCLEAISEAQSVAGRAEELLELAAFASKVESALADRFLPAPSPPAAVRVVDVRELVGARFEHVYLAGMVEGVFPAAPAAPELLSFEDMARLNALAGRSLFRLGSGLAGPLPGRLAEEPLLFHLALLSARGSVTLSLSRADERGRETLPSRFVEEVRRVPGAFSAEARPRGPLARMGEAATLDELFPRASLEHLAPPAARASAPDRSFGAAATWDELRSRAPERAGSIEARARVELDRRASRQGPLAPEPGPFAGGVQDLAPMLRATFAFGPERPLSPRVLSQLGNCRFQGFASLVLRLRPPAEVGAQADPAALGELYHRALQVFFAQARERGRLPLRADGEDLIALGRALGQAARELEAERPTGHPGLWAIALEEAQQLLSRAVRAEAEQPIFPGLLPARFEAELGQGDLPLLPLEGPDGEAPIYVGGRIDRIDAGSQRWAAIDYKSGRADSLAKRFKETFLRSEFQLALYAAALRHARPQPVDAALISLRDAEPLRLSDILSAMGLTLEQVLEPGIGATSAGGPGVATLAGSVWGIVGDARGGRFAARSVTCDYCPLGPLCRVDRSAEA